MSRSRILSCLLTTWMVAGCSAVHDSTAPDQIISRRADLLQVPAAEAGESSALAVEMRDVNAIGRTVRFRGRVTNHFDKDVEGVIYRLRLVSTDGERTLRTEYNEIDTFVDAGQVEPFQFETQGMYFATVPRFVVDAIPAQLGGQDFQAPTDWQQ